MLVCTDLEVGDSWEGSMQPNVVVLGLPRLYHHHLVHALLDVELSDVASEFPSLDLCKVKKVLYNEGQNI